MSGRGIANKRGSSWSAWQIFVIVMSAIILPWTMYVVFQSKFSIISNNNGISTDGSSTMGESSLRTVDTNALLANGFSSSSTIVTQQVPPKPKVVTKSGGEKFFAEYAKIPIAPVLGPPPTSGSVPLFGVKHKGGDAIFALACKYPKNYFQRFVGSLRFHGYDDDIVLAVSPPAQMKPGLEDYLKATGVVAYSFEVDCLGPDNCKLKDEFLGYPDPRPHRTFANIRYALYEYWMRYYTEQSYILILDFRDTFFQGNPFSYFGPVNTRPVKYDLQVYAENYKVKNIGKCVYNSLWVGRCFGEDKLEKVRDKPVICSGSTLGSYPAIRYYLTMMLSNMDTVQCWRKGIESDQGYQNYLFHFGLFNTPEGNATINMQGNGIVNTIGAMNGFRVPKDQKGPLDTFWKIRDKDGYVLNNDGTRSLCVHQWDRFNDELAPFVDSGKIYNKEL